MMKLAFCLFRYFPYGGLQRSCAQLIRLCLAQGHKITVFTTAWEGPAVAGIEIKLINVSAWRNHQRCLDFAHKVQRHFKDFDCIIGFNKMPGLTFYLAADPCYKAQAQQQHGFFYRLTKRYQSYLALERSVFNSKTKTEIGLLTTKQALEFNLQYQTNPERMYLLAPGIVKEQRDLTARQVIRQRLRSNYARQEVDFILLTVAADFKTKGVDRSLRAFAALPEVIKQRSHLWIIGNNNAKFYHKLAKQLKIAESVKFLGVRSDVADYMLAADVLLHPARVETAGMVLLEALQAGLAVLTSEVCGYASYIHKAKAGIILSQLFRQEDLNAGLLWLLQRPQWLQHLRANALAYAAAMDFSSQYQQILNSIESIRLKRQDPKLTLDQPTFYLKPEMEWIKTWNDILLLTGEEYRVKEGRRTIRFIHQDKAYFAKIHTGIGWREIFKNLITGRLPILDASVEYRAIQALSLLKIPSLTVVAYAAAGKNPAQRKSFLITPELDNTISLENFCHTWSLQPPHFVLKRIIIAKLAAIAKCLHEHGINHRDFYLCHFLLAKDSLQSLTNLKLYVIDLHRAQIRPRVPLRWIIKDLAGLLFSAADLRLTRNDLAYFIKLYSLRPLKLALSKDKLFWQLVYQRAAKLYSKVHGKTIPLTLS